MCNTGVAISPWCHRVVTECAVLNFPQVVILLHLLFVASCHAPFVQKWSVT